MGYPRLLEDGGERGSALVSDPVEPETANKGRSEDGERVSVSMGADTKANTLYRVAVHFRMEIIVSLRMAASAEVPSAPMALSAILQAMGRMGKVI